MRVPKLAGWCYYPKLMGFSVGTGVCQERTGDRTGEGADKKAEGERGENRGGEDERVREGREHFEERT